MFIGFIDNCFNDLDSLEVLDANGKDVTQQFISLTETYHLQKNYDYIQKIIFDNNYEISYTRETYSRTNFDNEKYDTYFMINNWITVTKTKQFYHRKGTVTSGNNIQEWSSKLTGTFTYDSSTYEIKWTTNPRLEVDVSSIGGALWDVQVNNKLTSYNRFRNTVVFTGKYSITAKITFPIGILPAFKHLDYGRHTETFMAMPTVY